MRLLRLHEGAHLRLDTSLSPLLGVSTLPLTLLPLEQRLLGLHLLHLRV